MKVDLSQYRSLYSPFCQYMQDNYAGKRHYSSTLAEEVLLEQFAVRVTIEPRSKLWLVDMSEEDYAWFLLRWS